MKILIVEDEPSLREVIRSYLEKERYVVETASDYRSAAQRIADYSYDCILLDITLPDGNGLELLRSLKEMRRKGNVIIISAKDSLDDKVAGLGLGADDYLPKPFHLAELGARIKSVMRRNRFNGEMTIGIGNITIYPEEHKVSVDGKFIELNRKEYDILHFFSGRPSHLVDKGALAEAVWGDHIDQTDNFDFLYAQIKNLRRKLAEANASVEIRAVYGFGYKLTIEQE